MSQPKSIKKYPRVICPWASEPPLVDGVPSRSQCVGGRIVHFITGTEMDCHECQGVGTIRDPASYICNVCGGSMLPEYPDWWVRKYGRERGGNANRPFGLLDVQVTGGYESKHIFDLMTYEWSMCEKCLRDLFERCVVKPYIVGATSGDEYSYEDDSKYYKFRMWERSGAALEWARAGKCNGAFECPNTTTHRLFTSSDIDADASRCPEHAAQPVAMNVEAVAFADVPGLERLPFKDYDWDAESFHWTEEEKGIIRAAWEKTLDYRRTKAWEERDASETPEVRKAREEQEERDRSLFWDAVLARAKADHGGEIPKEGLVLTKYIREVRGEDENTNGSDDTDE